MQRIGSFVSVKGYAVDMNILPVALPNEKMTKKSVKVEFKGQKQEGSLPLPVYLFVNDEFWKALGRDYTLSGALRYPVSNKNMFGGCLVVSPKAIIEEATLRDLCGFGKWGTKELEFFFSGLGQGIYANSLTIKELLCGDTDGDTAGIMPVDAEFTMNKAKKTITVKINNGDSKFFWAITETRDLPKRPFAELEGFTHLQGRRQINAAAVENVLGESMLATGNCALVQQILKGILDTNDKGLFEVI
jgi:hypothetical protein